ncbi:TonB-dependent receptor plug domain-containing protein, partial [Silvibacterium sp.]|uniref:TonB-dependent receptor plug domain-containing protein n=1 Tax=Silvibacterium sp. TaxID=1964179 RepID=UPI0039E28E7E
VGGCVVQRGVGIGLGQGFAESLTSPFSVAVNSRQRVDVSLQPGSVSQTVTVTGAASQLQTETSDSSTIINHSEVVNLPLNGRAYGDLATLVPGVHTNILENQTVTSRDASFNVNGQRSEFNNFLLDGLDNNAYGTSNQGFSNQAIPPSPDAIDQFQVQTNNYSAEFGRASGAVINVSIKSGTNKLHGSVWEYNRNTDMNAEGPFVAKSKPTLVRNQFGGAVGGPIIKDKLFFFADYEGNRQNQGSYATATIPTTEQQQGIFKDANGVGIPLRNPITGTVYSDGVVPQSDWTPLAKLVFAALPQPNANTTLNYATTNYVGTPIATLVDNKGDGRLDYFMSPKTTIFGRYSKHKGDIVDASPVPGDDGGGGNGTIHAYNQQIAAGVTHSFTQNQIVDARIGFTWTQGGKTPYLAGQTSLNTEAGIPGLPTDSTVIRALSSEAVQGFTAWGAQTSNPQFQNPFVIDPKINYTWLKGRHSLKFGWEFLSLNTEIDDFNPVYGYEDFNGGFSQYGGGTSASADAQAAYLTDFLTGARATYQLNNFVVINQHQRMHFFYAQDDFKLSPKVTINAGLRYELATPPYVSGNHLANFDPTNDTLIQAKSGSLYDRALVNMPKLDFAPNFGFAYQVAPTTVIRAAYGLSFDQFNREGGENLLAYNGPYIVNSSITQVAPYAYSTTGTGQTLCTGQNYNGCFRDVAQGYPTNFVSSSNFSTLLAETRYIPKDISTGYVQSYHADVQQQLGKSTTFTLSYVGSHGVHLWVLADQNQAPPNALGGTATLLARRPITGFTGIEVSLPDGFLRYNSMQAKLEHRTSYGLYLLNAFTWSHAIDNAAGHLDTPNGDNSRIVLGNPKYNVGQSAYNQPINDTLTVVYDLPYGKDREWGGGANRWVQMALGDWQLTATNMATSGAPVNLTYSESGTQDISDLLVYHPNITGNPKAKKSAWVKTTTSLNGYLDSTKVATAAQMPVNAPLGNSGRNSIRDQEFNQLNLGLHKSFRLWNDTSKFELRGEAFNALNHVNYQNPDYNRSDSTFGEISSAFPARQLQVAGKITF